MTSSLKPAAAALCKSAVPAHFATTQSVAWLDGGGGGGKAAHSGGGVTASSRGACSIQTQCSGTPLRS